ncbi:hypothetical protein MMC10_009794 [Thelotrema lepadinum]|nr:hypothetical protein [Thelotrema lepadinum]
MSSSTNTNPLKRCDGKQPACSHCEGYEYECSYSKSEKREKTNTYAQQQALEAAESSLSDLRGCLHQYDGLIEKSIAKLAEPHKLDIERSLHSIRSAAANSASALALDSAPKAQSESRPPSSCLRTDPYHGEASDVQFYNLVKQVFQEPKLSDPSPRSIDNYDQDEVDSQEADSGVPIQLPSNELVEEYLELYFATIHIAYPFIPQQTFLQTYKALRNGSANERVDASWLATFYIIMALGSYYMSFASRRLAEDGLHEVYYHRAQWLSAVRLAQSTGLHAEGEDVSARPLKVETRRRTWYSLYVLDRLLALQLGRPPAIHDEDCYISVPSRIDETNVDWTNDSVQIHTEARPIMIDYFLHVIEFSKIVGQVLRKLYGHGYKEFAVDDLLIAKKLDDQLLLWRSSLPRLLRFDLGHAFENSATFKRQVCQFLLT